VTRDQFFFHPQIFFRQLWVCYFVAPSLTRGWVCNLLLLLVLASAVPRNSRPYFIVPILETPPICRARSPRKQGGPVIPPGTEFPFLPLSVRYSYYPLLKCTPVHLHHYYLLLHAQGGEQTQVAMLPPLLPFCCIISMYCLMQ
jgi:hypothetical protein